MLRYLTVFLAAAVLVGQYIDDRNLFEILQDDLDTAMVHAHLSLEQRKALSQVNLTLVKAAAKLRAKKPFDKAEIKDALQEIGTMEDAKIFRPEDRKILDGDRNAVALGVEGKVALDGVRRAPGSVY